MERKARNDESAAASASFKQKGSPVKVEETVAHASRRWRLTTLVVLVAVLGAASAVGGGAVPAARALGDHSHSDSHTHSLAQFTPDIQPAASPLAAGTILQGGEIVSHLEGGAGARSLKGTGGGRMIYTGTTAAEPTLGIDGKGNLFFQGLRRIPDGYPSVWVPLVVVSSDGGRSWDDVTPPTHPETFDPMLYVDPRTGRAFTADLTFPCIQVSGTDDVGESWTTSEACGITDHQTVFAGPPVSSATVDYPNVVYVCAMDMGATSLAGKATSCLKSLDGGVTWVRTGAPAYTDDPRAGEGQFGVPGNCGGGTGHGVVDSKGIVYLPRGWCEQPYLAISKDEGATWERIQVARTGMAKNVRANLCVPVCTGDLHYFDHEAAVAVDRNGNIYYSWVARDRLPYLVVSTDGGKSFSKPVMVAPPNVTEAWGPKLEVGATGRIALAYVGSTNAPGGAESTGAGPDYDDSVTWNGYVTTSVNALSKDARFFTSSVNPPADPIERGACSNGCGAIVDFIDLAIGPDGRPWTSMVDGCPPPGDDCQGFGQGFVGTVVGGPNLLRQSK